MSGFLARVILWPRIVSHLTQVQVISIPPRSTQKWCQIIHLGLVSMALKFFVIVLIFGGSMRAKNARFIMYIIYIIKIAVAASFLRFCQNKKNRHLICKISENIKKSHFLI